MRGVSSKTNDPALYVMAIQKHLLANNVYTKSAKIFDTARAQAGQVLETLVMAINKIDTSITRVMLMVELKYHRKPQAAWSKQLAARPAGQCDFGRLS
jgi:hypothetical protein